jgi:hypothetical protein
VLDFARRHAWDEAHCRQVTALALSLFDQTTALHGLGPAERELLEAAGLLHDVGYAVAQSSRHKHSLYLIRNAGQVLSRKQLLSQVWGYDFDPGSNVVEVYVRYLRRKLGASRIQTVRGVGYRMVEWADGDQPPAAGPAGPADEE